MLWLPTARALVLQVAVRLLPAPETTEAAQPPIEIPLSWKLTLPVGAAPLTVAVNITLPPISDGLGEPVSVVVVGVTDALTTCDKGGLFEELLAASPL
jgi:hypothetical protein